MPFTARIVDRFRDLADVNFTPGAGVDGYAMVYDHATGKLVPSASVLNADTVDGQHASAFALASHSHPLSALTQSGATTGQAAVWNGSAWAPGSAGVTDHGALTGLADDDHAQYVLVDGSRAMTGPLRVPDGADSAPGFAFTNQASTGFFYSGSTLRVSVAGTQRAAFGISSFGLSSGIAFSVAGGATTLTTSGAALVPLTVNLAASQTANAIEVRDNTAALRFNITAAGNLHWRNSAGTLIGSAGVFSGSAWQLTAGIQELNIDSSFIQVRSKAFLVGELVQSSGVSTAFTLTGAAHTSRTASTESIDAYFNLSRTVQWATGALTTQRAVVITPPTYAFVGASTITTAVTLDVTGAPAAGTNATITDSWAARFQDRVLIQASTQTRYGLIVRAPADSAYDAYRPIFAVQKADATDIFKVYSYFSQTFLQLTGNAAYLAAPGLFRIDAGGYTQFTVNSPSTTPAVQLQSNQATQPTLRLNMYASQSADPFQIYTSAAAAVFSVSAAGGVSAVTAAIGNVNISGIAISGGSSGVQCKDASANVRFAWNGTGIGFFATTPVAKAAALTAADAGALNTGDAGSDTVIANIRTRLGELESRLQAYGLLT